MGSRGALIGEVGVLMLPLEETVTAADPLAAPPLPCLWPTGSGRVSQSLLPCPRGSLLMME